MQFMRRLWLLVESPSHFLAGHDSLRTLTDLASARQWVSEFAAATAMSDLIEDFDKLLARSNRSP